MAILGVARDRASVERLANAINEKDMDGEPGLNMDEFRDFAITNGLRPAELRKTAAKGSSDLLAVETQISVARRRQMLDALMGPGSPTSPEKRKQLDQLRAVWKSASESRARYFFTKSFLDDDAAVLAPSSGEEPAPPCHRTGVASMAWRS